MKFQIEEKARFGYSMMACASVRYIKIDYSALATIEAQGIIPREDVGVYLTAKEGQAQCFVSANHKLIRILAQQTGEFECLTPSEFVSKYLNS